ncbi:unnamed protein product [Effrenium voratum]|nr:unnamed protein product [Effrenium voratum]
MALRSRLLPVLLLGAGAGGSCCFLRLPSVPLGAVLASMGAEKASAKAASVGLLLPETKVLPDWTPPWAGMPAMMQVGVFILAIAVIAGVAPIFLGQGPFGLKPPVEEVEEEVKEEKPIGVTDELFDPRKRRERVVVATASASRTLEERAARERVAAGESAAPTPAPAAAERAPAESVEPTESGSAWQRLKEGL